MTRGYQIQFLSSGEVGDMQTGIVFLCQFYSQTSALITSLLATDLRMVDDLGVVAVLLFCPSHIAVDNGRVLTMCHNRQFRRGKELFQSLTTVD